MQRFIIIFFLLFACQTEPQKGSNYNTLQKQGNSASQTKRQTQSKAANSHQFEITTLQSASGWGYQISQNGKLVIDQPAIPGRPGNLGFQTEEDAIKVAELVKSKLLAKDFPPSISEADLQNLNIH
jgi:Domain of unknown function (DUF4907)